MFPNNIAEFGYAMECEGDLPTRAGQINKAIKMLKAAEDPMEEQYEIFAECGINIRSLTTRERNKIENAVGKVNGYGDEDEDEDEFF